MDIHATEPAKDIAPQKTYAARQAAESATAHRPQSTGKVQGNVSATSSLFFTGDGRGRTAPIYLRLALATGVCLADGEMQRGLSPDALPSNPQRQ